MLSKICVFDFMTMSISISQSHLNPIFLTFDLILDVETTMDCAARDE